MVSGSAQARSILLAPAPGQPENVLDYQLVSLAAEAGDLGREAFLALAAPVPKAGRDDKTGESLVWIEALTLFSDVWFARVEDVRLNGVSVPWSIDETPRLDGRPCRSKRVLRGGHLRVAVPYESLAAGNVEIRYVAAASVAAWAVAGDAIVNDDSPERWGIGGFEVPLVQRVECKPLGRGAQ